MGPRRSYGGGVCTLLLFVLLLAKAYPTVGSHCRVEYCSQQYTRDMEAGGITPGPTYEYCTILSNYATCVRATARSCRGQLKYHMSDSAVVQWSNEHNCSYIITHKPRDITHPRTLKPKLTTLASDCLYQGHGRLVHCGLFGDPHLRTIAGDFQTCKVLGAWPLINNPYLEVQVTNEPVVKGGSATATSKITVIIRDHGPCTDGRTYEAEKDYLPGVFTDGSKSTKPDRSIRIKEEIPGRHVEIQIRHIATRIIIRQVGHYLTFAIRLPLEIANLGAQIDNLQLCVRGCPKRERIDHREFLSRSKHWLSSDKTSMAVEEAVSICRKYNTTDSYFDACVFDLLTTGDSSFSQAAQEALEDLRHLHPAALGAQKNRTSLKYADFVGKDDKLALNSATRQRMFNPQWFYLSFCSVAISAMMNWLGHVMLLT